EGRPEALLSLKEAVEHPRDRLDLLVGVRREPEAVLEERAEDDPAERRRAARGVQDIGVGRVLEEADPLEGVADPPHVGVADLAGRRREREKVPRPVEAAARQDARDLGLLAEEL